MQSAKQGKSTEEIRYENLLNGNVEEKMKIAEKIQKKLFNSRKDKERRYITVMRFHFPSVIGFGPLCQF